MQRLLSAVEKGLFDLDDPCRLRAQQLRRTRLNEEIAGAAANPGPRPGRYIGRPTISSKFCSEMASRRGFEPLLPP